MDEQEKEIMEVVSTQAEKYMNYPVAGLHMFIGEEHIENYDVEAPSGKEYEIRVAATWVKDPDGDIQVMVAASEKALEEPKPLAFCFVMRIDNSIDEERCEWKHDLPVVGDDDGGQGDGHDHGHDHGHKHGHKH